MTTVTFSRFQNGRCDVRLGGEVVGFVGKSAKHYMGTYVVGFHGEGQITYADSLKDAKAIAAQIHAAREQFAREEADRSEREKALADIRVAQRRLQNAATAEERQRAYDAQSGLVRHVASTLGVDAAIALGREADRLNREEDEAAAAPVALKPCDNCGVSEAVEPADFCHECIQRDRAISDAAMTPMQRLVRNALIQAEVDCEFSLSDFLNYVLGAAAAHEAACRRLERIRDWAEARSERTGVDYLPAGGARIAAAA